ncbi:hypothetical protein Bbelb_329460 [Branchiostoma belcheri]|nr:hypothetical protein Bbelb_329460 [Branchiostoma belcheri]
MAGKRSRQRFYKPNPPRGLHRRLLYFTPTSLYRPTGGFNTSVRGGNRSLPSRRHSKTAMTCVPHNGRRKRGRPKHTWRRTFQDDLRTANIPWEEAETAAADKKKWKHADRCAIRHRRN